MNNIINSFSVRKFFAYFTKEKFRHFLHKLVSLKATPTKIALSISLGIFIGLLMPIGLQTIIVIPIATFFECNIILATSATLISNPLTMVPIYYSAIRIGEFLTGKSLSWDIFEKVFTNPTWDNLLKLGNDGLIVFFSGSFFMAIIAGVIFYLIVLQLIITLRRRKEMKGISV